MKKILYFISLIGISGLYQSCTDVQGDGIDTIVASESKVAETLSYYNPVWDFDITNAHVFLSSGPFYALGNESEWAKGIDYKVPVISSSNLMNWSVVGQAFAEKPNWAEGKLNSVTGVFSKSLGTYYVFYMLGNEGVGVAESKTPQGPYTDLGKLLDKSTIAVADIKDPFVYAYGSKSYVFFTVPSDGVYGLEIVLKKGSLPTIQGTPFKIAKDLESVYVWKKDDSYYMFGIYSNSIVYGKSDDIKGPYTSKEGADLLTGNGSVLVQAGERFNSITQVSGLQVDGNGNPWILYNAIDKNMPMLESKTVRSTLMLNTLTVDENGWFTGVITANGGYEKPRFSL